MFSPELESFQANHTSSDLMKMQNLQDMHQGEFQFIFGMLSIRKSGIEPVTEVTEWVNSFEIVEKKVPINSSNSHSPEHSVTKKLQICLDPRDLNEALEGEQYSIHSIEEIIGKFDGMKKFTG